MLTLCARALPYLHQLENMFVNVWYIKRANSLAALIVTVCVIGARTVTQAACIQTRCAAATN